MALGKVKFYDEEKGWGFIKQDDGTDLFVHISALNGQSVNQHDRVEFDVDPNGRKGPQATNVRLVES